MRFDSSDGILAILAEPMNGIVVIEANSLASNKLAIIANEHRVDIEVLARAMELARQIGGRGRRSCSRGVICDWFCTKATKIYHSNRA